ncbi:hypothetical protein CKM354_000128100 [Cercospora kikuchii]|uniref:Zn(2)-C6 fungal-type domain-containing protein n=1 Tax=Cercospora kikuchii TaxID=84275 RepID=A0A9P3CCH7_9PEZI|nr:uncharacterized protein CKM354_000128100 [Cercospora kikuchii]GIZ37850.1 hypothetical protein CKM354_000128100 [Cercospora kikuchii]
MARKASTRKTPARNTTTRKAPASASPPAAAPIDEPEPRTRNNHNLAQSKDYPSCYWCSKRRVRCGNTDDMMGFPCTACVRRGTTAGCVAHKDHPEWVPGVSGATHKRKRKVKQLEKDTTDEGKDEYDEKPKKKQKNSKRKAGDVEVAAPVGVDVPVTNKLSKRKADALEPKDEDKAKRGDDQQPKKKRLRKDKTVDEFAAPAAPLPETGSPRRSLSNNVMHTATVNDGDEVQSEGEESDDDVPTAGETSEEAEDVEELQPHADQLPGTTITPDASKLSTVQDIESSLGDAADRPEVGLVLEQMHSRQAIEEDGNAGQGAVSVF